MTLRNAPTVGRIGDSPRGHRTTTHRRPARAGTFAGLADTPAAVSPTCTGTEAMVAPLQDGDRLNNGVRVAVRFSSGGRYGNAGYNRAHSGPAREQWSSLSAHTAQRASGRQVTV